MAKTAAALMNMKAGLKARTGKSLKVSVKIVQPIGPGTHGEQMKRPEDGSWH